MSDTIRGLAAKWRAYGNSLTGRDSWIICADELDALADVLEARVWDECESLQYTQGLRTDAVLAFIGKKLP